MAKKEFACNGTVVEHSEYGEVIQLQVPSSSAYFVWLLKFKMNNALLVRFFDTIFSIISPRYVSSSSSSLKMVVFGGKTCLSPCWFQIYTNMYWFVWSGRPARAHLQAACLLRARQAGATQSARLLEEIIQFQFQT